MVKQLAMQIAKVLRGTEYGLIFTMFQQQYAEIIVAYIRRKAVTYHAIYAFVILMVDDGGFQHFNHRERIAMALNVHIGRNDFYFNRIAVAIGIVPMCQIIEAVVHHL